MLLELFADEKSEILKFLLTPRCRRALASDERFVAWVQEEVRRDPLLLGRIRRLLDHTRSVLLAAAHSAPGPGRSDQ